MLIEHDDVEVDLVTGAVSQDEVPGPRVRAWNRRVSKVFERGHRRRHVALLDHDVEVLVAAGHGSQTRVDGPAAVQPDADAVGVHDVEDAQNNR